MVDDSSYEREKNRLESLSCVFSNDVLCSYRKDVNSGIMSRCFNCSHYSRFKHEMEEEDEKIMDEIDEIHRTGVWK